jgi:hypothetical protein
MALLQGRVAADGFQDRPSHGAYRSWIREGNPVEPRKEPGHFRELGNDSEQRVRRPILEYGSLLPPHDRLRADPKELFEGLLAEAKAGPDGADLGGRQEFLLSPTRQSSRRV